MTLMYKNDVVQAVVAYLKEHSFEIEQVLGTMSRGVDIIAKNGGEPQSILYVEAMGETSSKESSSMLGQPFNSAETKDSVAKGLYRAAELLAHEGLAADRRVALALPETELHRKFAAPIQTTLEELGVGIFWVDRERKVSLEANWEVD